MQAIILFTVGTLINVILSTIRSLLTIKGTKFSAATINAITYGFYTYVIILTAADGVPIAVKMGITALLNFVCVYIIKHIEQKRQPVKMWKVEMALPQQKIKYNKREIAELIKKNDIPYNVTFVGNWWIYNCYCDTPKQVSFMKNLCKIENGRISAYESQDL